MYSCDGKVEFSATILQSSQSSQDIKFERQPFQVEILSNIKIFHFSRFVITTYFILSNQLNLFSSGNLLF